VISTENTKQRSLSGLAPSDEAVARVAIYTRKSVTAGLDQEFNSLDAQREAVEAYVASQRGHGWEALPDRFDDNGYSGSNVERPAFQELMRQIETGCIDVVCVYRMDRLSRSLLDFARLMEFFNKHSVAFVSVTESFDTSSPMGRMVLGMLATFAQFERESIAQRTSDKMQASRRRGMWTGGRPPFGFDVVEKKLVVNTEEAKQVLEIFKLYLEWRSLLSVVNELRHRGITTKQWTNKKGALAGGSAFTKSSLRGLLTNPLYVGKVRCGDEVFDGAHEAIVDQETWDAVQELRESNGKRARRTGANGRNKWSALLQGIARCACGSALTFHHSKKGSRIYGYYSCSRYQKEGAASCPGSRVSAGKLEAFVVDQLREIGRDPRLLAATLKADKESRKKCKPELATAAKRATKAMNKLVKVRDNILDAIAQENGDNVSLAQHLEDLDAQLGEATQVEANAKAELRALDLGDVDADELREVLADLEPVWGELLPAEKARAIALLLERVTFDANAGEVEITFRPGGSQQLLGSGGGA